MPKSTDKRLQLAQQHRRWNPVSAAGNAMTGLTLAAQVVGVAWTEGRSGSRRGGTRFDEATAS